MRRGKYMGSEHEIKNLNEKAPFWKKKKGLQFLRSLTRDLIAD